MKSLKNKVISLVLSFTMLLGMTLGIAGIAPMLVSAVAPSTITVSGPEGATSVVAGCTMPMSTTDVSATWAVTNGTGDATIDSKGVLTTEYPGTVTVTSTDGSVSGSLQVTVVGAGTGEIDLTVTNDDTKKDAFANLSSGCIAVADQSGNVLDQGIDYSISVSSGSIKISYLPNIGDYYVTITYGGVSEKIKATVTKLNTDPTKVVPTKVSANWDDATSVNNSSSKAGVLGGVAVKADGTPDVGATVEAYNSTGTLWSTKADSRGAYKLYLPSGTYTLVLVSDNTSTYKNISTNIKVVAGSMTGPLTDLTQTVWGSTDSKLGYATPTTISSSLKTIKGAANTGSTVAAYNYVAGSGNDSATYTLLGKPVIAKNNGYTLTLNNYPVGDTVVIRVTDLSLNVYENDTTPALSSTASAHTMTLSTPSPGTINTAVVVNFADATTASTTSFLASDITTVTIKDSNGNNIPLYLKDAAGDIVNTVAASSSKKSDYSVSSGKITINAGILSSNSAYAVTVNATGYTTGKGSVTPGLSKTAATAISGTFTPSASSTPGDTTISTSYAAASVDKLVYEVVASSVKAQCKGNVLTGTSNTFTSGSDISGVDSKTNNCVDIYEINSTTSLIVAYKRVALKASYIGGSSSSTGTGTTGTTGTGAGTDDGTTTTAITAVRGYNASISYTLGTGTFSPTGAIIPSNWNIVLNGTPLSSGTYTVSLSNNNRTALIATYAMLDTSDTDTIIPLLGALAAGTTAPSQDAITVSVNPIIPAITGASLADAVGSDYDGEGQITLPTAATGDSYVYTVPTYPFNNTSVVGQKVGWSAPIGNIVDLADVAYATGANPSGAQNVAALSGLHLFVAEVDGNHDIIKFVDIPISGIVDYHWATKGSFTGTVSFPRDGDIVDSDDSSVVSAVNGQARSFTITVDGGAPVTVNISADMGNVTDLINTIQAPIQHTAVVSIGANNCIQIVSGSETGGTGTSIVLGGNYQAFFGSATGVPGTNAFG